MFNTQDVARYRMEDTIRKSEAGRRAHEASAPHRAERRAIIHRMAVATVGMMIWPFRH